jgi:hypothetical protein
MPDGLQHWDIIIATRNRSALQAIAKPRQQSGQGTIREIYRHARRLEKGGNTIKMRRASSTNESFTVGVKSKTEVRKATDSGCKATKPPYQARSTRLRVLLAQRRRLFETARQGAARQTHAHTIWRPEETRIWHPGATTNGNDTSQQCWSKNGVDCVVVSSKLHVSERSTAPYTMQYPSTDKTPLPISEKKISSYKMLNFTCTMLG